MSNRSYLCGTNLETIYPSFVDKSYDSENQTISCDVYCVPLLWTALFRPADIVRKTFKVERDDIVAEAPLTRRSVAIRQLGEALPYFNQVFSRNIESRPLFLAMRQASIIAKCGATFYVRRSCRNTAMPHPRRFLFLSLAGVVVGLVVGVWLLWPRTPITRENVARIQRGMTRIEVQAILGGPARDDSTGPTQVVRADVDLGLEHPKYPLEMLQGRWANYVLNTAPRRPNTEKWESDETVLWVQWNADGTVAECDSLPLRRETTSPLDMLYRWLAQ